MAESRSGEYTPRIAGGCKTSTADRLAPARLRESAAIPSSVPRNDGERRGRYLAEVAAVNVVGDIRGDRGSAVRWPGHLDRSRMAIEVELHVRRDVPIAEDVTTAYAGCERE
jgi:hypothetical protein